MNTLAKSSGNAAQRGWFSRNRVLTALFVIVLAPVSYTHLTLPTKEDECRSRWSPYH